MNIIQLHSIKKIAIFLLLFHLLFTASHILVTGCVRSKCKKYSCFARMADESNLDKQEISKSTWQITRKEMCSDVGLLLIFFGKKEWLITMCYDWLKKIKIDSCNSHNLEIRKTPISYHPFRIEWMIFAFCLFFVSWKHPLESKKKIFQADCVQSPNIRKNVSHALFKFYKIKNGDLLDPFGNKIWTTNFENLFSNFHKNFHNLFNWFYYIQNQFKSDFLCLMYNIL